MWGKLCVVVVVYHVTVVAIGHGLFKVFWPIGCVLRTAGIYKFDVLNLIFNCACHQSGEYGLRLTGS